jgi:hypothetical protein
MVSYSHILCTSNINMEQAPEPEVLKRKRSRPSDWWANGSIISSTPQRLPVQPSTQQDESEPGPAKKRGRLLISNASRSPVRDAPAAGNRGRPAKKGQTEGDANDENRGPDELAGEKSLRRGRSSGNAEELRNTADPARDEPDAPTSKNKRGRKPAQQAKNAEVSGDYSGPKRRGRPAAVQAEQEEDVDIEEPARDETAPKRGGRPSIKESDVQAAVQEEGGLVEPKKRGRRPAADKTAQASNEQEPEIRDEPRKRGRRPVETKTDDIEESVVPAAAKKRVRRSDADTLNQDPRPSTAEEPVRGRPRTRRSDAELQALEVTPQVSTQEERGRRRTRLSNIQSQQDLASKSMRTRKGKGRKTSRQPQATTINVESASSKLTKAPSGSQRVSQTKPIKATNVQETGQTKQRAQQSSSQPSKKTSKQKSNAESSRKRKDVDSKSSSLYFKSGSS